MAMGVPFRRSSRGPAIGPDLLRAREPRRHGRVAPPEVVALLAACPRLTLLATGRAARRVRGAREWSVAPLASLVGVRPPTLDAVAATPAVGSSWSGRTRAVPRAARGRIAAAWPFRRWPCRFPVS